MHPGTAKPSEFRGHLYLFVDTAPAATTETPETVFADVFGRCEPGQMRWYLSGWAVGKTDQGRYCSRTHLSKARRFTTFAEAMDVARQKRKARPQESFHLVYELDGNKAIVTSLAQILRIDQGTDAADDSTSPDATRDALLDRVAATSDRIVASNALTLYHLLQHEGEAAARARFSGATYERLWHVLVDSGVVTETV